VQSFVIVEPCESSEFEDQFGRRDASNLGNGTEPGMGRGRRDRVGAVEVDGEVDAGVPF